MIDLDNNIDKYVNNISSNSFSNRKFKLKKNNYRKIIILSKPQINHIKLSKDDITKIKEKTIGDELIKFRKKLYKKFMSDNLNLLNNNIKSLKVKIKYIAPEILLLKFASGKYLIKQNKIELIKYFKEGSTNHELLHMATSFYNKKLKIGYSGFQQIFFYKNETIGYGLNEGYTDLLTSRYFNDKAKYKSYSYEVCTFFAEKLEEIVGRTRMENFYLNADLFGLYHYLLNFDTGENIVQFIIVLDYLLKHASLFHPEKCENYFALLECYLTKWCINKNKQKLNNGIIDENTFNKNINNYIDSLSNEELYIENYVKEQEKKEYCK